MTKRQRLEQAFQAHGIHDAARLESHIRGCDLTQPVNEITLLPANLFQVWVRIAGVPGKYGAPIGEDPTRLGIMIEGRQCRTFRVRRPLTVIRCTAAWFPAGLIDKVGGNGGGTQYILPPDWLTMVEEVS